MAIVYISFVVLLILIIAFQAARSVGLRALNEFLRNQNSDLIIQVDHLTSASKRMREVINRQKAEIYEMNSVERN
jgi:hypothetical protein